MMSNISTNTKISRQNSSEFQNYDTPRCLTLSNYDRPKKVLWENSTYNSTNCGFQPLHASASTIREESYDIPRPLYSITFKQKDNGGCSSKSSSLTTDSLSLSSTSSASFSDVNSSEYDMPRRIPLPLRTVRPVSHTVISNKDGLCSEFVKRISQEESHTQMPSEVETKELSVSMLLSLQKAATIAINNLLLFVVPNWRTRLKLGPVLMSLKLAAFKFQATVHELTKFSISTLNKATGCEEKWLATKLLPLVRSLIDADYRINYLFENLQKTGGWTLENLAENADGIIHKSDILDQLLSYAQILKENIIQTTSFIQRNASLIFTPKSSKSLSNNKTAEKQQKCTNHSNAECLMENHYTCLTFNQDIKKSNSNENGTSQQMSSQDDNQCVEMDKQLIRFYAEEITSHMHSLKQAIDVFLETVEKNQPPKLFVSYGKYVVLTAFNVVSSGDILCRKITDNELKGNIILCLDSLRDAIQFFVNKSKNAATYFPSVTAVQEMINGVADITNLAKILQDVLIQNTI